jgi:hypothetical protein
MCADIGGIVGLLKFFLYYVMFNRQHALIAACMLFVAGQSFAQMASFGLPKTGSFVLSVGLGSALLKQCSRDVPRPVSGFWLPSSEQIAKLEQRAVAYVGDSESKKQRAPDRIAYHRQYVGVVVKGKRLIYGNFYPANFESSRNEASSSVVICDGGASFWGLVFDPETNQILELRLNGEA